MIIPTLFSIFGLALLAKHQVEILRYRYKRAEICPYNIFPTGPQSYHLTKLAEKCPQRPTVFIPVLGCWTKRLLYSEIIGSLIIFGCLCWSWNYSANFPLILSIALGGISWIYITKFVLTITLKLCDYPSVKLVAVAMITYPTLLGLFYGLLNLIDYFNIYKLSF